MTGSGTRSRRDIVSRARRPRIPVPAGAGVVDFSARAETLRYMAGGGRSRASCRRGPGRSGPQSWARRRFSLQRSGTPLAFCLDEDRAARSDGGRGVRGRLCLGRRCCGVAALGDVPRACVCLRRLGRRQDFAPAAEARDVVPRQLDAQARRPAPAPLVADARRRGRLEGGHHRELQRLLPSPLRHALAGVRYAADALRHLGREPLLRHQARFEPARGATRVARVARAPRHAVRARLARSGRDHALTPVPWAAMPASPSGCSRSPDAC